MIPLKDNIPSSTVPVVNYLIIALCALAFVGQLLDGADGRDDLIERYGMVPARVMDPDRTIVLQEAVPTRSPWGIRIERRQRPMGEPPFPPWLTLLTSMFLHGGWLHFLGNMLFLYIFGDNVEDRFGHGRYLLFYLLAGVGAAALHLLTNLGSAVPTIGASGAIAGVMGAYFLLYPRARVLVLVPIIFLLQLVVLPAALFLGLWFLLQLFQGTLAIGSINSGGVAWWAHIGGFLFGLAAAAGLRSAGLLRPPPTPMLVQPHRVHRGAGLY